MLQKSSRVVTSTCWLAVMIPRSSLRYRRMMPLREMALVAICLTLAPFLSDCRVSAYSPFASSARWGTAVSPRICSSRCTSLFMSSAAKEWPVLPTDDADREDNHIISSMPWGEFQSWALRDNLLHYVVSMPVLGSSNDGGRNGYKTFALWRTMIQEVTELAGYDPKFLMAMYEKDLENIRAEKGMKADASLDSNDESTSNDPTKFKYPFSSTPDLLPFLDQFEFTPEGGVSGRAYGLPGIADGAMITTSAVADVEKTLPKGYIRTKDNTVAYELGIPSGEFYSLDGTAGAVTEQARKAMLGALARTAGSIAKGGAASGGTDLARAGSGGDGDDMMIKLAGSTGILLAGATAMSMLSHHLTVNVFWV